MKKALLISIAAMLMAAPMAQAQTHGDHKQPQQQYLINKHPAKKVVVKKHWQKGQHMSNWNKHSKVTDYKRHGLRKPGPDQRWVKVDNDYVLISIASGVIAGIVAAH
ncbi:RcnB family protein [Agrobacterium sp. ES01]|uniref:RcnB family protein n=1 Tax=Agrobacterium sp. ES01 TaxID=3420714 RepID=UPI003D113656